MRYTTEQDVWLRRCWNTVEYILLEIERITYQYDETVLILCQFSMLLFHLRIRSTPSTINRDDLIQYYFLRFIDGGGGGVEFVNFVQPKANQSILFFSSRFDSRKWSPLTTNLKWIYQFQQNRVVIFSHLLFK